MSRRRRGRIFLFFLGLWSILVCSLLAAGALVAVTVMALILPFRSLWSG